MKNHCDMTHLEPREEPPIGKILTEIQQTVTDASTILGRMQQNSDVLNCYWDGQSDDGRRHQEQLNEEPFPWEGASDARIPLCEEILNEQKLTMRAAQRAGRMQAVPRESADAPAAALITPVLNYVFGTLMKEEIFEETSFLADWMLAYGHAILHPCWHEEKSIESATVTEDDLLQFGVNMGLDAVAKAGMLQVDPATGQPTPTPDQVQQITVVTAQALRALVLDPERRDDLVAALMKFDPAMPKNEARRVATALEKGKPGLYYRPYVRESRPKWVALLPFVDVFYPVGTVSMKRASWVAMGHWLTEVELEARAEEEEWDPEWLQKVKDAGPGACVSVSGTWGDYAWAFGGAGVRSAMSYETAKGMGLYQVLEIYRRAITKAGLPWIYRLIAHGKVTDMCGSCEPSPYAHGEQPFIAFRRERRQRALASSTGIPERGQSFQDGIKFHHDTEAWRTELATTPPFTVPTNRAGGRQSMTPFAQIPEKRAGSMKWMEPPRIEVDAVGIQTRLRDQASQYFGRTAEAVDPSVTLLHSGELVEGWLQGLAEATRQTSQLLQQYMEPIKMARVAGMPVPLSATREDIQGQFDVQITFDVRDLNMEFFAKKLNYLKEVLGMDSNAVTDRSELVNYIFSAIDPQLASRVLKSDVQAGQDEIADEQHNILVISSGMTPPFKMGVNYQLRLQILQMAVQQMPNFRQALATNPKAADAFEKRWKFLQQQVTQEKNKVVGALGVDPTAPPEAAPMPTPMPAGQEEQQEAPMQEAA
jgi:hypothetical protein